MNLIQPEDSRGNRLLFISVVGGQISRVNSSLTAHRTAVTSSDRPWEEKGISFTSSVYIFQHKLQFFISCLLEFETNRRVSPHNTNSYIQQMKYLMSSSFPIHKWQYQQKFSYGIDICSLSTRMDYPVIMFFSHECGIDSEMGCLCAE